MPYRPSMTTAYGARLAEAMEAANLRGPEARAKLAKALNISVQSVGQALNGDTRAFSAENNARAARFLRVDSFWLATGEGEPRPPGLSEDAIAWARQYDRLDTDGRAKFSAAIVLSQAGTPAPTHQPQEAVRARAVQHEDEKR